MSGPNVFVPDLQWFMTRMREKLEENAHKPDYHDEEEGRLLDKLDAERLELMGALCDPGADETMRDSAVISECADIANYAMMIAAKRRTSMIQRLGREIMDEAEGG